MSARVTSARVIGRAREAAELEQALDAAAAGQPSLVLLGGDSGVGKSRLLRAFADRAAAAGTRVLVGDCLELAEGELPYAPIVGALRPLARAQDPVFDRLPPSQRNELGRVVPGLTTERLAGEDHDATAQSRLFEALLALLDALARDEPVLLAIEDLHWADHSSRAFVTFLARCLSRERVLVVATYRSDELHRRHPLRPMLAELERDRRVRRVDLRPLSRDEVGEALADILGRAPSGDLVERIFSRSEGNPLYAEELVAAGRDGRGALPASLRDALMLRIERLGEPAQEVLRLLAVGQRLDHGLLADAGELNGAVLRAAVREAVTSHLIVAEADGTHAFRHALLREVVADDLLPGERTELHLALGRALQRRATDAAEPDPQIAAGAAYHLRAGPDRAAALAATVRAAAAAERIDAFGEAAAQLEHALELWEQVPEVDRLAGCTRVALLVRAADAHFAGGDRGRQGILLRAALDEVDEQAEPRRAAALLEKLARGERGLNRTQTALETARRALALLDDEPSRERASLLGFVAKTRMLQGRYRDAAAIAREALAVARQVGDRGSEATALDALGLSLTVLGELDEGPASLREAIEIARADGRPDAMGTASLNLGDALHLRGRSREALDVALAGFAIATPGRNREWLGLFLAELAFDVGDWAQVSERLPPPDRRLFGSTLLNADLRRAELALARGEHEEARALFARLEPVAAESAEPQFLGPLGALRAEMLRREGDLDGARRAIDDALDRIEFCTEDVMRLARVTAVGVFVEADRAERARDLGDVADARLATARVIDLLQRLRAAAQDGGPVEAAWSATGEAHAARAQGKPDPAKWAKAVEAWEKVERPYPTACSRFHEAEAHLAAGGDRVAATRAAREALAGANALGARWLAGEITSFAARARLRLDVPARPSAASERERVEDDPFGLTPRERQVLARVARGATNREIGAELFMAEKTASVHVSRILAKLDVKTRTQAAAVAHRVGLGDESGAGLREGSEPGRT